MAILSFDCTCISGKNCFNSTREYENTTSVITSFEYEKYENMKNEGAKSQVMILNS